MFFKQKKNVPAGAKDVKHMCNQVSAHPHSGSVTCNKGTFFTFSQKPAEILAYNQKLLKKETRQLQDIFPLTARANIMKYSL